MDGKPPYTITEKAADYLAKIVETVTRLELDTGFRRNIRLRRENRMRTIHSSLAIEGNSLSLNEVTAVIQGKIVAGKQEEIKEVKNAYEAYDKIMSFNPYSVADFLRAHQLMTQGPLEESGRFRNGNVGVFDGGTAVHLGARPQFVPQLTEKLFGWAEESQLHPVLKSSILHYEIETIHPFADGNGRIGRLWQTLLLAQWNEIFAWIPMESVLYRNRPQYYSAIEAARKVNDSGVFIEFTLSALYEIISDQEKHQIELSETHLAVLKTLEGKALPRKEIFAAIGLSSDTRSFKRNIEPLLVNGLIEMTIIEPLLVNGLIEMTIPDKPNSRLQKYRITGAGKKENGGSIE